MKTEPPSARPWESHGNIIWSPDSKSTICQMSEPQHTIYMRHKEAAFGCAEALANKAYIVRCVNSHDELVEALDQLLHEAIEAGFDTATDYGWPKSIADARAALAKARGEP